MRISTKTSLLAGSMCALELNWCLQIQRMLKCHKLSEEQWRQCLYLLFRASSTTMEANCGKETYFENVGMKGSPSTQAIIITYHEVVLFCYLYVVLFIFCILIIITEELFFFYFSTRFVLIYTKTAILSLFRWNKLNKFYFLPRNIREEK